jgi:hypothetical protein
MLPNRTLYLHKKTETDQLKKYLELFFTENCEKIDNACLMCEPLNHILCSLNVLPKIIVFSWFYVVCFYPNL